jgi:hypothetical protein
VRIRVENINTRQFMNYNKALRLVEKGYAAFVGDDRKKIRYLEHYELMLLRADMRNAQYEQFVAGERGGNISGEWQPAHSGRKPMSGGPQCKTMQFSMKVRS